MKLQIELAVLCALIGHFFGEAKEQLWEKKHHLSGKCLLDIYLSKPHLGHNGRAMGVKNGNQDGLTRSCPRDFHSTRLRIVVSMLINQARDIVFPFAWTLWGFISCHLHSFKSKIKFYSRRLADVTIHNLVKHNICHLAWKRLQHIPLVSNKTSLWNWV